ncbi:MAG: CopG family transcriptional regulator [Spirochaetaceae bacterium]|nr:CopG family transcriptional regulator [Spirochaetaceae bacterium]
MDKRIGFIGILLEDRWVSAKAVQEIISTHSEIVLGRMGLPGLKEGISVITLIVESNSDQLGAITGKLGRLQGVTVKSGLTK